MIMDCEYCKEKYSEEDPTYVYGGIYLVAHPRCFKASSIAHEKGKNWQELDWNKVKIAATPQDNDPKETVSQAIIRHGLSTTTVRTSLPFPTG